MISPKINRHFIDPFKYEGRYLFMMGGAGSSKSYTAAQKTILRCMAEPGHRMLATRKVKDTLRDSVYRDLLDVIHDLGIEDQWSFTPSSLRLKCTRPGNGSEILCKGMDDYRKIKSIKGITSIWMEEATEFVEADFQELDTRLRSPSEFYKQIILTFNPVDNFNWIKTTYCDDPHWMKQAMLHKSNFRHNAFLDKEYKGVLEARANKSEYYRKVYFEGEWGAPEGRIFNNVSVCESMPDPSECKWWLQGGDFGFSTDPFTLLAVARHGNDLYVDQLIYEVGLLNSQIAKKMQQIGVNENVLTIFDSAEIKSIHELQNLGVVCDKAQKGAGSVVFGVGKLQEYDNIYITQRSKETIAEFNSYVWAANRNGEVKRNAFGQAVPIDKNNHTIDAVRYAATYFLDPYEITNSGKTNVY